MDGLSLVNGPLLVSLYLLFLIVATVVTIVRTARLAWRLCWPISRPRISLETLLAGAVSADQLANSALAAALAIEPRAQPERRQPIDREAALHTLRMADSRFQYLWTLSRASAIATRGLLWLTLLATGFITIYGFYPAIGEEYNERNVPLLNATMLAGRVVANRLAVGLFVCAALWAVYIFFQGRLLRRMARWRYFYATAMDALSRS